VARERDERWVYVALAVLALAFLAYRYRASIHIPTRGLSKIASSTVAYALAPIIGIIAQFLTRRRNAAARREWDSSMKMEGRLRDELSVRASSGERWKGAFQADVHLTRSALYVLDRGGRRNPMRFALRPGAHNEPHVVDAQVSADRERSEGTVRIEAGGPSRIVLEFVSADAMGWWSDLRRALPKPVELVSPGVPPETPPEESAPGGFGV
jgi:hypothetical protein